MIDFAGIKNYGNSNNFNFILNVKFAINVPILKSNFEVSELEIHTFSRFHFLTMCSTWPPSTVVDLSVSNRNPPTTLTLLDINTLVPGGLEGLIIVTKGDKTSNN